MRCIWIFLLMTIGACTSSENPLPEDEITSYTDGLWRSISIEFELQLAEDLNAFDVGPFLVYNRRFDAGILPMHIVELIKALNVSLPPNEFPSCTGPANQQIFRVRVIDSNGDERAYMDEMACNVGIGGGPKPEQVIGILEQNQLYEIQNELLEFDPNTLNP